jgi:hypothetical protein
VLVVLASASQLYAQGRIASINASAGRNATKRTSSAQAVLHISATIVRVAIAPQTISVQGNAKDLFITMPSRQPEMEVTSALHPLPDNQGAAVETTTIALR